MTQRTHRILVIEDDERLRAVVRALLESQHYIVIEASAAGRGLIEARSHRPDLIILDLGLPDRDGLKLISDVRAFSAVPILVLSARALEQDKIAALDAGADDYVTKPFSAPELSARVRATLRRLALDPESPPVLQIGAATIDLSNRTIRAGGQSLHLTPLEFRVLQCLARNAGVIVTQRQLIREAWGPGREADSRGLRAYVKSLRQKLEPDPAQPRYLLTEAGVGYRLQVPDADAGP